MTLVAVSYGNSFVVVFCWAWPRSSCCFVALETKRKSGWGICGSSLFVLLWFCVMICNFHRYRPIALCTAFFTAYVVIRTVPQSINGQTRRSSCLSQSSSYPRTNISRYLSLLVSLVCLSLYWLAGHCGSPASSRWFLLFLAPGCRRQWLLQPVPCP